MPGGPCLIDALLQRGHEVDNGFGPGRFGRGVSRDDGVDQLLQGVGVPVVVHAVVDAGHFLHQHFRQPSLTVAERHGGDQVGEVCGVADLVAPAQGHTATGSAR